MAAATTAATLAGSGAVWLSFAVFHLRYGGVYLIGAGAAVLAALLFSGMSRPDSISPSRPRLLLRRRYTIFYLLNILYGARKQIFLTFGPWMLIKVLGQSPADIAKLWMAAATLGILVRALLGRLIDRTGERVVLVTEGIVVVLVCLGYGLGPWLWAGPARLRIAEACYVVDQLLIAVSMARTTYLYKIAERKEDLTPPSRWR
jgi:nitrate/nitrite transporter NarK